MSKERLSNRQIATLKQLAICCEKGDLITLTRDQREAMIPPWSQFSSAEKLNDHPEQTRFRAMEWEDGQWNDVGFPMWCDIVDGNIDDEQCVGRVGKKAAGRLLDGVAHNQFPTRRASHGV